jgi:hypothetical protein
VFEPTISKLKIDGDRRVNRSRVQKLRNVCVKPSVGVESLQFFSYLRDEFL